MEKNITDTITPSFAPILSNVGGYNAMLEYENGGVIKFNRRHRSSGRAIAAARDVIDHMKRCPKVWADSHPKPYQVITK